MRSKELRKRAWDALRGRYWWALLAALIAWLFGVLSFGAGSGAASGSQNVAQNGSPVGENASAQAQALIEKLPAKGMAVSFFVLAAVMIIGIAMSIMSSAVHAGYCRFNIALFREVDRPGMGLMFSRLGITWKAFWMDILICLLETLGFVLLIIPGIIISLKYSQAHYILGENPDLSAREAMRQSGELMKGNKWSLFCLHLSFIGWGILAALVPGGFLLLTPYTEAANAAFFLDRTGRL